METTTTGARPRPGTHPPSSPATLAARASLSRRLAMRAGLALLLWSRRTTPRVTDERLLLLDAARREAEREYDRWRAASGARVLPPR
ncbi:MAG: hypothetical protein J0G30_03400 [Actinomycetales bacterium]|nr:hypothetical protein [Actinomycetales bacterium]